MQFTLMFVNNSIVLIVRCRMQGRHVSVVSGDP